MLFDKLGLISYFYLTVNIFQTQFQLIRSYGRRLFFFFKSKRGLKSKGLCQNISNGFNYPIYIITSSFNSSHLSELQRHLEGQHITLSFQNQTDRLKKIPTSYQRKLFIVLNDFRQVPTFHGQFLKLSCEIAEYPKQTLQQIIIFYKYFVQKEKSSQMTGYVISELIFLSNMKQKKQIISSINTQSHGKIQMRSISKIVHNYKNSFSRKLFVYSNSNDQPFFSQCLGAIKQYQIQNCEYINRIEEYLRFLSEKQDVRFFVVMSEYSAINLRKFFKKCDDMVVCTKNPEACMPLLRGKVTHIICDIKVLGNLVAKNFRYKHKETQFKSSDGLKQTKTGSGVVFPIYQEHFNVQTYNFNKNPHSSIMRSSLKSGQNLKIAQQFSLLNSEKRQLNLQSSTIGIKISPKSPIQQSLRTAQSKENQNPLNPIKQLHEEAFTSLTTVQLQHIDLAACREMDLISSVSGSSIFSEIKNKQDRINQSQSKVSTGIQKEKQNTSCASSSQSQNFMQSSSKKQELQDLTSRASQRSKRNARILQKYRALKRQRKLI